MAAILSPRKKSGEGTAIQASILRPVSVKMNEISAEWGGSTNEWMNRSSTAQSHVLSINNVVHLWR